MTTLPAPMSSIDDEHSKDKLRLQVMEKTVAHRDDWDGYYQVLQAFVPEGLPYKIYVNQLWPEWRRLMEFLTEGGKRPKRILEIGTGRGGSTYFLIKLGGEDSLVVTVDSDPAAAVAVDMFTEHPGQRVRCLTGSSADPVIVAEVAAIVQNTPIDLLYIDGDHSYEGVKLDFELYKEFCRPGSIVCFHDIIPDYGTTKGINTEMVTGEVYKFWAELKGVYRHLEIVEELDQNGFGLGLIFL